MSSQAQKDIENSKRVIAEITEHKSRFGIPDKLWLIPDNDYRAIVKNEAYFWVDHHDCLRHQFSGEILAASTEQVDILIEQLHQLKEKMTSAKLG